MRYEILDANNAVIGVLIADDQFMAAHYPHYRLAAQGATPEVPSDWWIDVGPFIDRLGMDGPAIGASSIDACRGAMAMLTGRKYVDLKGAQIQAFLGVLMATGQPTANATFPGSGPMTQAKIDVILGTKPTDYEKHKP